MSLDRYLAVVHPIESVTIRTERNASILAGISWLIILCGNAPVLGEHGAIEYQFADGQTRSACMNYVIFAGDVGGKVKYMTGLQLLEH
jgi:7 transmembrane receptor (rhodopsin family)